MLVVFVTLACARAYIFSELRPDVRRGLMNICMLCISVIIACVCVYLIFVIVCWAGPVLLSSSRCRAGPYAGQDPMMGGAHYMFIVCMVCGILGELTKLCAYGFQFMFQVLLVRRGRARADCIADTTLFHILYDLDVFGCLLTYFDFTMVL